MRYLIDAYNVLHLAHRLPDHLSVLNTTDLCRLIDEARIGPASVVCDGSPKPDEKPDRFTGPVQMIHAGRGRDADSLIEQMLEEDPAARHLTVVSNDRRIRAAARRKKAKPLGSEAFLQQLAEFLDRPAARPETSRQDLGDTAHWLEKFDLQDDAQTPESPKDTAETDRWMREFGYGEEDEAPES